MSTIVRFEDLEVWKKSRELSMEIWRILITGSLSKDFELKNQLNRTCGSIMDNIAEGFERNSKLEFINFLSIAEGSTGELRSQLYRALDRKHISIDLFKLLLENTIVITKMLNGLMIYLNTTTIRGKKFKGRQP